ncbi:FadR family transcriptional regulator [Desulfovibrio sp. OttesenSCG-928-A18]|nr:FadR family transcriptional regulator [Desulfovibrio sp. OttesenSCG-928-A18]
MNAKTDAVQSLKKRHGLPEELASIIIRRIEDGDFKLGDVLPSEQALAEIYQVSRTVVREALARLKYEGIIMSKRGSGPVVCSTAPRKGFAIEVEHDGGAPLSSFFEFRLLVEGEAAALAAIRHNAEHKARFEGYLEQMVRAIEEQTSGADPDYRFHCLIADAAGNEYLSTFTRYLSTKIWMLVYSARGLSGKIRKRAQRVYAEHRAIYEAIAARDPVAARQAAQAHLLCSARRQGMELDVRHLVWDSGNARCQDDEA